MKLPLLLERDMYLFHSWDAMRDKSPDMFTFRKAAAIRTTFLVYGNMGTSDLTGKPTVEDFTVMWGTEDVTNQIPEALAQEWVSDCIEEYG
jgi:hypothetical protein